MGIAPDTMPLLQMHDDSELLSSRIERDAIRMRQDHGRRHPAEGARQG
jgi:hypothetical protein